MIPKFAALDMDIPDGLIEFEHAGERLFGFDEMTRMADVAFGLIDILEQSAGEGALQQHLYTFIITMRADVARLSKQHPAASKEELLAESEEALRTYCHTLLDMVTMKYGEEEPYRTLSLAVVLTAQQQMSETLHLPLGTFTQHQNQLRRTE